MGNAQEDEEQEIPTSVDITSLFRNHTTGIESFKCDVLHLPRQRRCAADTLHLVATVDVDKGCTDKRCRNMAEVVLGKLNVLWNRQGQSIRAD